MFGKDQLKTFSLSVIDVQEKATKEFVAAFEKMAGPDFATYTWGLNYMNGLYFTNARKVVQEFENFSFGSNKG
jgi:hypothetical protein